MDLNNGKVMRVSGYIDNCDMIYKIGEFSDKNFLWVYVRQDQIVGVANCGFRKETGLLYLG